jgi:hypothetical protein
MNNNRDEAATQTKLKKQSQLYGSAKALRPDFAIP